MRTALPPSPEDWPISKRMLVCLLVTILVEIGVTLFVLLVAPKKVDGTMIGVLIGVAVTTFFGTYQVVRDQPEVKRRAQVSKEAGYPLRRKPTVAITGWTWLVRSGFDDWEYPPHADMRPVSVNLIPGKIKPLLTSGESPPLDWKLQYQYYRCLEVTTLTNHGRTDCVVEIFAKPSHENFGRNLERLHHRFLTAGTTWPPAGAVSWKTRAPTGCYFVAKATANERVGDSKRGAEPVDHSSATGER